MENEIPLHITKLGCGCNQCTLREFGCPFCKWAEVGGEYSTVSPYEWFWWVGTGDDPVDCEFCGQCGIKLPDYGIHPAVRERAGG